MESNLRHEAEVIYHAIAEQPPDQQADLLDQHCGSRQNLRREVQRLLDVSDDVMGEFLLRPPTACNDLDAAAPPERIGRYKVEQQIGEGGMGLVFAGRQENPDRPVALKLLRPGLVNSHMLRRFRLEVDALAALHHAGIAHIYEAGTIDLDVAGGRFEQPYFAMELVEGVPITEYATREKLGTWRRIELLIKVCEAVQHAHQKGIIHRDLKPANILVEKSGSPKVLDFGVARAVTAGVDTITQHTQHGQLIGTLAYMSPEQICGDPERLDTRSDVYSLGVLAFELLSGRLPYNISGKSLAVMAKEIIETPPAVLSTLAGSRPGDLDTVLAKALEKDAGRRYASVDAFADDLRRVLNHEPIAARPPSTLYQFRKFTRRNRGLVAGLLAAFLMLVVGTLVSAGLAVQRGRALRDSVQQKAITEAVNEFLTRDLLASADPNKQPDRNISLREVVDRAAASVDGRFADAPMIEASIRTTLSNTYKALGEYAPALLHARRALELQFSVSAGDDRETIRALNRVGSLERHLGLFSEAERRYRDAYEVSSRRLGPEDESTLSILNNLGLLLENAGRPQEAAEILERVVAVRTRLLGEQHNNTMTSINNLALVYVTLGRYDEAEPLYLKELEYSQRVFGDEHPGTLISKNNLAVLYLRRGEPDRAGPLVRKALEGRLRILGADHPHTIESIGTMGTLLAKTGKSDEGRMKMSEALERSERTLGPTHPLTLHIREQIKDLDTTFDRAENVNSHE